MYRERLNKDRSASNSNADRRLSISGKDDSGMRDITIQSIGYQNSLA